MELLGNNTSLIPTGNPNVIREAAFRDGTQYGLTTELQVTLTTEYEQKYIGDIDPGSAMLDVIKNLTIFGTSESKAILSANSDIIKDLMTAHMVKHKMVGLHSQNVLLQCLVQL